MALVLLAAGDRARYLPRCLLNFTPPRCVFDWLNSSAKSSACFTTAECAVCHRHVEICRLEKVHGFLMWGLCHTGTPEEIPQL